MGTVRVGYHRLHYDRARRTDFDEPACPESVQGVFKEVLGRNILGTRVKQPLERRCGEDLAGNRIRCGKARQYAKEQPSLRKPLAGKVIKG